MKLETNNKKIDMKYKSAMNHIVTTEDFNDKTIVFIQKAREEHGEKKKRYSIIKQKKIYFAVAVCFISVILLIPYVTAPQLKLEQSTDHVKVKYVNNAPDVNVSNSLISLTEEEIIMEYSDVIFQGTVQDIQNIQITFGTFSKNYRAIATIRVEESLQGDLKQGDIIEILLPCSINDGVWVEDTKVISNIEIGSVGIFMPMKYDETSIWIENDETLYLQDICDYGFPDGERFAFMVTEKGLVYDEWSFDINPAPSSLEDIKLYLNSFINSK